MTGAITRVVADRGFGFIKDDNSTDYYLHRQEVGGGLDFARLKPGDRVSFEEQHIRADCKRLDNALLFIPRLLRDLVYDLVARDSPSARGPVECVRDSATEVRGRLI